MAFCLKKKILITHRNVNPDPLGWLTNQIAEGKMKNTLLSEFCLFPLAGCVLSLEFGISLLRNKRKNGKGVLNATRMPWPPGLTQKQEITAAEFTILRACHNLGIHGRFNNDARE